MEQVEIAQTKPVTVENSAEETAMIKSTKPQFGISRMRPNFGGVPTTPVPTPEKKQSEIKVTPVAAVNNQTEVKEESVHADVPKVVAEVSADTVVETEVPKQVVADKTEVSEPVIKTEDQEVKNVNVKAQVATAATPAVEPQTPVTAGVTYSNPLDRIKEIKQEVNTKVGNPVNLIDANNQVGREYMNALLDAMKKVNGGSDEEVNSAMQRLEAAYGSVKETIKDLPSAKPAEEKSVKNEEVELDEDTDKKDEQSVAKKEDSISVTKKTAVKDNVKPSISEEVTLTQPVKENNNESTNPTTAAADKLVSPFVPASKKAEATAVTEDISASNEKPAAVPEKGLPKSSLFNKPVEESVTETATQKPADKMVTAQPTATSMPLQSVAKEKQLENMMTANKEKEAMAAKAEEDQKIASMDPLMTPSIDSGLNQLLSEWNLFKSSGIFGTGPSGVDHPLYKRIASLSMSAVIAGRFEGATPEVKQSITDYMNGWRYEEGILHQHEETFEHYLRRVIQKILEHTPKAEA